MRGAGVAPPGPDSAMNPDAAALQKITELRMQMIRQKLDRQHHDANETDEIVSRGIPVPIDDISFRDVHATTALEVLLQAKKERLKLLEAQNMILKEQLAGTYFLIEIVAL